MAEKSKTTSKKKTGSTKKSVKKTPNSKKRTTTGAKKGTKSAISAKKTNDSSGHSPILALTVMGLLTVVAVLSARLYDGRNGSQKNNSNNDILITSKDLEKKNDNKEIITENLQLKESSEKERAEKHKSEIIPVKIYLIHVNNRTEKVSIMPVTRNIHSESKFKNVISELIKGPNSRERNRGLLTAIPGNLRINSVRKNRNTAIIDFTQSIETGANGSILLNRIDQIVYTLTQFEDIDTVTIKINGKSKRFLGSDGLSINGPIQRRKL